MWKGVSTELLMRHVWGEGVTSSSKHLLASRAVSLSKSLPGYL